MIQYYFRGGKYITLSEKKNGKYLVGTEMATYNFKLTVYDEDYAYRKDADSLMVFISAPKNGDEKDEDKKDNDKKVKYIGKNKKSEFFFSCFDIFHYCFLCLLSGTTSHGMTFGPLYIDVKKRHKHGRLQKQ